MRYVALLGCLALGGCITTTTTCPPLVTYSPQFQKDAAGEWKTVGWRTRILVTDYSKLRDACRAIK